MGVRLPCRNPDGLLPRGFSGRPFVLCLVHRQFGQQGAPGGSEESQCLWPFRHARKSLGVVPGYVQDGRFLQRRGYVCIEDQRQDKPRDPGWGLELSCPVLPLCLSQRGLSARAKQPSGLSSGIHASLNRANTTTKQGDETGNAHGPARDCPEMNPVLPN